ncbi:hypothetical protein GEV33_000430 [Tenebrio molitor]|uniref:Uncharacterized protein n=1 Tax=Tenebrio molitor TaxID=7067 RepID=A0A8J6HUV2_TENMO|nr:hypothetical protein GEV33_000430 [Tenebrio molitor]
MAYCEPNQKVRFWDWDSSSVENERREVKTRWDLEKDDSIERSVFRKIVPLRAVVRIEHPSAEGLNKVECPGAGFHFTVLRGVAQGYRRLRSSSHR